MKTWKVTVIQFLVGAIPPHTHTHKCMELEISVRPHPVGVSVQGSNHGDEERLLQQSDHSADHGLEACQSAKVVGRVAVGEIQVFTDSLKHQMK